MELLETSYQNCPQFWDHDVIVENKHPITIAQEEKLGFPTVAQFNRSETFNRLDVETLFFSFYY